MESEQEKQQVIPTISTDTPKKGINIWIITTIVLLLILVGIGIYQLGKNQNGSQKATTMPQQTVTEVPVSPAVTQLSPTKIVSPVPTSKKVSAGATTQFFSPYTVIVPSGWTDSHSTSAGSDTLTLTKGQYSLTISQAAGGAGSCDFPGDTPEPMAQVFTSSVGITGTFAQFKRGTSDSLTYTVCEQKNSGFVFPTSVGNITYKVPVQIDQSTLSEMDGMVASLAK